MYAVLAALALATAPAQHAADKPPKCYASAEYRVVEQAHAGNQPGADFLVRPRRGGDRKAACRYDPTPADFVIRGEDNEQVLRLAGPWLLLDNGTGTDNRDLMIWSLPQRRMVFRSYYGGVVKADVRRVVFWMPVGVMPTEENCPDMKKWESMSLSTAMEMLAIFDLTDMKLDVLPEQRCITRQ